MASNRNLRWEEMDKSKTDLSVLMQHFEVNNRTEGKSPRTVGWYNEVLGLFMWWLGEDGSSTAIGDIDENTVRRFILHVQERPGMNGRASTHTVANRVRALKAFFAWLGKKGYTKGDLLRELKMPKTVDQVIEPLNEEEINKMFSGIDANTLLGARNSALVSLMLDTGLRLSEVAYLEESDVHLEDRYLKVLGKGGKERIVAFGVDCQRAILHYYHDFRVEPAHTGVTTFFLTIDGYPWSPPAIKSFFKRFSKAVGLPRLHPHLLRHTYATKFIVNGGDFFILKLNLGHSTLVMVENYLHLASRQAAVQSQEFSPLDSFNVKYSRRYKHGFDRGNPDGKIYSKPRRRRSR